MEFLQRYEDWGFPQDKANDVLPQIIRINTLVCSEEDCLTELQRIGFTLKKTKLPLAYEIKGGPSPVSTLAYLSGWFYLQELASQCVLYALDPKQNTKIADVAAAPGSKTTQCSQWVNNTGIIIACDTSHERLLALQTNATRMRATNILAYHIDGKFIDTLSNDFDYIICDVPCAGNFTQDPQWLYTRTHEDVLSRVATQKKLLEASVFALKKGGTVAYSTCSLEIEENEEIIEWALKELPVKLIPHKLDFGHEGLTENTRNCLRLWPQQDNTGGFFIALLQRI